MFRGQNDFSTRVLFVELAEVWRSEFSRLLAKGNPTWIIYLETRKNFVLAAGESLPLGHHTFCKQGLAYVTSRHYNKQTF